MSQKITGNRKYYFNNEYFDRIDTEEKAYWLGFLYADGYISSNNNGFGCSLKKEDESHLKKFLNCIEINNLSCLQYEERTKSYGFDLFDANMYNRLVELGFTPNKSYDHSDKIFFNIPDSFKRDFIRGLWDGDGYVSISSENKNITGIVSNNNELLVTIAKYLCNIFDKNFCKVSYSDGYPRIRLSCKKAYFFCTYLYNNSKIYLDRKYNAYLKLNKPKISKYKYKGIKKLPSGRYYTHINYNNKRETIGTFDSIKEAIKAYNKRALELGKEPQIYIDEKLERDIQEER